MFLRTKGPKETAFIKGEKRTINYYGKNMNPFRIHGYYSSNGYFVITKIDPNHDVHK
ncbi:MAG6450 family protein [Listeria innocua]|uniref:MAG6450 family protein n=1 Tax=Listeria innocua TaxID=1642 RepID=UPI0035DFE808